MSEADKKTLEASAYVAGAQFARMFGLAVTVAARTHPEEIRNALGLVFDLSAVEEQTKRAAASAMEAQRIAREALSLLAEVEKQIDRIEGRIDACNARIDQAARKFVANGHAKGGKG